MFAFLYFIIDQMTWHDRVGRVLQVYTYFKWRLNLNDSKFIAYILLNATNDCNHNIFTTSEYFNEIMKIFR